MKKLIIEPHYFGSFAFFASILHVDELVLEVSAHYSKQTYKNRAELLTSQGKKALVVPVHFRNHTPLRDVKIDYQQKWQKGHLGLLESSYKKSPFFDFYFPEIEHLLHQKHTRLIDLSVKSMTLCLKWLQIDRPVGLTDKFYKKGELAIWDMREAIHPKKAETLSEQYCFQPYFQNFGNNFVSNLSVLDCLMNTGPECVTLLKKSLINQ